MKLLVKSVLVLSFTSGILHAGAFVAGHDLGEGRDLRFGISVGQITEFNGMVEETTRRLYDVTGSYWKQDTAESYNLDDFNLDDAYTTYGLTFETSWKYFTFQLNGSYMSISSDAVARRDYYLTVGSVSFDGQEYDHLKIPAGSPFSYDFTGASIEANLLFTPFTFRPVDVFRVTPLLGIGLFGVVGQYEIDAGESTGIYPYQNPLEDFVVGGEADGPMGFGMPEYGGGLEFRLGHQDGVNLVIHGYYALFQYDGSTDWLTSADHREKNAEIDHQSARLRVYAEFPLSEGRSWLIGAQYHRIESEGMITSTATDPAEILAKQERFDKEFEFGMTMFNAMIGLTF